MIRTRLVLLPLLILASSLGLTWTVWNHERQAARKELQAQFDFSLREAVSRVEQRMAAYEQMLRGVQGLFAATGAMNRDSLRTYVGSLNLDANFSGILAIGLSEWVPNRTAPGADPWSDPVRRLAMEKARDSGLVAISGKVLLPLEAGAETPSGFAMYLPIYARGQPQNSVDQRRTHLTGWVYASFRMNDLMASLYGEQAPGLALTIYDGVEPDPAALLYPTGKRAGQHQPAIMSANEYLVVAGHTWTLSMRAQDDFNTHAGRNAELLIAVTGTGLSLLLALLAWQMASGRHRALRLATTMTREFRESEEKLRAIADNVSTVMFLKDLAGRYLYVNRRYETLFHVTNTTIQGKTDFDMFPAEIAATFIREDQTVIQSGQSLEIEELVPQDDGLHTYMSIKIPIRNESGDIYAVCGIATDITDRKKAETELRIGAVAFDSLEGMMVTDANSVILRVNRAFTDMSGYAAEETVGQTPRMLQSGQHSAEFYRAMWDAIHRTGGWQGEIWDRRKNGEVYPKWLTISAVKGSDGSVTNYIGTHTDITERKQAEEKIEKLAFFDALTLLPNRTLLLDRLKQAMTTGNRDGAFGAVLFIDLDHFKTLNDTLGHDKGDLLLQQVALRLASCVREGDTVARLGGDEFVVVLKSLHGSPQEAANQTESVGEKILAALGRSYQLGAIEHRSTASIGATLFCGHETSIDDVLRQADLAMYKAKETGRNALRFFDPAMQTAVMERAALESGLRRAIDGNQFVLHYQAQVVDEGRVTGAEVLVRWRHPERGLVPPLEFIPLAEETGLILPLGDWVLNTACTQLAAWATDTEMAHLTLAVNVSAQQFRKPDFVAKVLGVLSQTGANPNLLKLELTESLLVDNVQDIIEKMVTLKARGVGFSLDDFGTGYSSLSYLKLLPLDQLKIDKSFVRDILVDPNDAAIAKTIVALAQSLGLGVIAEGVETLAQWEFLASSGCHAYQGFFFSRPLPVEGFEALARHP